MLYAERGKVISEQGYDRCKQNERGGQGPIQIQRESSEFNEVVKIDQQKYCMTDSS